MMRSIWSIATGEILEEARSRDFDSLYLRLRLLLVRVCAQIPSAGIACEEQRIWVAGAYSTLEFLR